MWGDNDMYHETNQVWPHSLSLSINVVQSSLKPLLVGSYTEILVSQIVNKVVGVEPLSVTVMNEREAIVDLREEDPIMEVSHLIPGLTSWEGQSVNVGCMMSSKGALSVLFR